MKPKYPVESAVFLLLLIASNLPGPAHSSGLALFPSALYHRELWRWFTFPWAHLSLYHLTLDATAFLSLYNQLRCRAPARLFHLFSCTFFSGLLPILLEPRLDVIGLRGLSGVAHGLMVVTAFESLSSGVKSERALGLLLFISVVGKCIIEQLTGTVLFARYHLGNVGLPVPSCHLGGALGAALSLGLLAIYFDREE